MFTCSNFNSDLISGISESDTAELYSAKRVNLGVQTLFIIIELSLSILMRMNSDVIWTELVFCCISF